MTGGFWKGALQLVIQIMDNNKIITCFSEQTLMEIINYFEHCGFFFHVTRKINIMWMLVILIHKINI